MTNPQAVRQGGIDVEHLPGDPVALFREGVFPIRIGPGRLGGLDQGSRPVIVHGDRHGRMLSTWPSVWPRTLPRMGWRKDEIAAICSTPSISLATAGPKSRLTCSRGNFPSRTAR